MFVARTLTLLLAGGIAACVTATTPPTGTAVSYNNIGYFDSGTGALQSCVALQTAQGQQQTDAGGNPVVYDITLSLQDGASFVFSLKNYGPFQLDAGKDCSGTFKNGIYSDKVLIKYPGSTLDGTVLNVNMDYIGGSPNLLFRLRTGSADFGIVRNFTGNSTTLGSSLGAFQSNSVYDFTNALPPSVKLQMPTCNDPQGDANQVVLELDGSVMTTAAPGATYTLFTSGLTAGTHALKAYCSDESAIRAIADAAGITAPDSNYFGISAYAPGTITLKVPASGSTGGTTAQINYQFDASTSASDQQLIQQAANFARTFFSTTFGITLQKASTVVTSTTASGCGNGGGASAFTGPQVLTICIANQGWTDHDSVNRQKIVVHEMFHLLQFEQHWLGSSTSSGPQWLIEGSAEYVGWLGIANMTTISPALPLATSRGCMAKQVADFVTRSPPGLPNLDSLETAQQFSVPGPTYALGMLAVDQLVTGAGANSLLTYGTALAGNATVASAFQSAFGTAQTAFYA
ncbi:MAG TPA: hypothetical protein VMH83_05365, partial [Candidatus Acidoferrum sp.]|nr:hypothetical protein [Candidatus Acidoferrum sp.]